MHTFRKTLLALFGASLLSLALPLSHVGAADAAGDGHGTAESHGDGGHHETGAPLPPSKDAVLWSIITFGLFVIVLKKAAWGPLIDGLNKREASLHKLVADAQHDRDAAIKMLAEYDQKLKTAESKVGEIIAEARRDADATKADIVATAQREAELTRQRALDEIARAKDQAVNELFSHMRANVVAATERVLARTLNESDHQRLIDEALAEVRRN